MVPKRKKAIKKRRQTNDRDKGSKKERNWTRDAPGWPLRKQLHPEFLGTGGQDPTSGHTHNVARGTIADHNLFLFLYYNRLAALLSYVM